MVAPMDMPLAYLPEASLEVRRYEAARADVEDQVRATGGSLLWPIVIDSGDPAKVIAERATTAHASLIVMGLRKHGGVDRLLRDETTLRVMQRSGIPVLGVTSSLRTLPKRVIAAVDFSRASLRAARLAMTLLADGGTLSLVFVRPDKAEMPEDLEGREVIFVHGVRAAFARLQRELAPPAGVRIETVLLEGPTAEELGHFADRSGADLIAVGSHRRSLLNRVLLGSVAADLVRRATCSLLVTPPA
jgi:nucleotide-binding universal stress UspA family protein